MNGYRAAVERLRERIRDANAKAEDTFVPLFEALNWAASVDIYFIEGRAPIQDPLLTGVRFARNRVHHQWADALVRVESPGMPGVLRATGSSRLLVPPPGHQWNWADVAQLPPGKNDSGRLEYETHLEGRSAEETLLALTPVLNALI